MPFSRFEPRDLEFFRTLVPADRFSTGSSILELHSKDESHHGPYLPEAVLWPETAAEVSRALAYCHDRRLPATAWGAGSSLEGNPVPAAGGLVFDFSRMNKIIDIRAEDFQVDVQPGVLRRDLNEKVRTLGLFFPPDPGANATIGGMIANNASGTRTVRYGSTRDHVLRLEVVLADGQMIHTGNRAPKTSSGYDLTDLFVGSEGTLGLVVLATLRLKGNPEELSAAVASFPSVTAAGRAVFEIMRAGLEPAAIELLAPAVVELLNRKENLGLSLAPTLLMEFHGPSKTYLAEVTDLAREIAWAEGGTEFRAGLGRAERDRLWEARHKLGEHIFHSKPGTRPLSLDVAVPLSAYGEMIALAEEQVKKTEVPGYIFSHAGDGNLHVVLLGGVGVEEDWAAIARINEAVVGRAIELGGTATGEHGVGLGKKKFMAAEHGAGLDWMIRLKELFDPAGILNPGKII